MRLYIAGPMRGIEDYNYPAFDAAQILAEGLGHEVFSPAAADRRRASAEACEFDYEAPAGVRTAMLEDLAWICKNAEGLICLPGANRSKGATVEMALARCLDIPLFQIGYEYKAGGEYKAYSLRDYSPEGVMW